MKMNSKKERKKILLEASLLKRKRREKVPKLTAKELAERISRKQSELQGKTIRVSQSAIARVESGDLPYGITKTYMILELFDSVENFDKRVVEVQSRLKSKRSPNINESYELYNLIETHVHQSHITLNSLEIRKEILSRFGDAAKIERSMKRGRVLDGTVKKILVEIRELFSAICKWDEINNKIVKSKKFYTRSDIKKLVKKLELLKEDSFDYEKKKKKIIASLSMKARLGQVFSLTTFPEYKSIFANFNGKHGKIVVREFLLQLYLIFRKRDASQREAFEFTYKVANDLLDSKREGIFAKYKYFSDIFDEGKVNVRNKTEAQFNWIMQSMIEDATKTNPVKSKAYRYPLKEFIFLFIPKEKKVSPPQTNDIQGI